jgi:hypothetical protein
MATTATMNIALLTWENVYWLSQLLLVAFAGLALVSGRIVNNRQAAQSLTLQTELATARRKQAEAERSLLELQQLVREPRTIDEQRAHEILDWGEKASVEIFFSMIGDEPSKFAEKLGQTLDSHGWRILSAQPVIPGTRKTGILITGYGDSTGTFIGRDWSGVPEPAKTLHRLLVEAVVGNEIVETRIAPDKPKDRLAVTIAAKY